MNETETDRPIIVWLQCTRLRRGCDFTNWRDGEKMEPGESCPNCETGVLVLMDWAQAKGL